MKPSPSIAFAFFIIAMTSAATLIWAGLDKAKRIDIAPEEFVERYNPKFSSETKIQNLNSTLLSTGTISMTSGTSGGVYFLTGSGGPTWSSNVATIPSCNCECTKDRENDRPKKNAR